MEEINKLKVFKYKKVKHLHNYLIFFIPFVTSLIIYFPILLGKNFPLWSSDNLFGIYPFIEISRAMIENNNSSWFPLLGRGIDFSASVNNLTYSPVLNLFFKLSTNYLYPFIFFIIFLCYYFVGVISYYVINDFIKNRYASLFGASIYHLSFASLYYLQTFPNTILQLAFLLSIFIIQRTDKTNFYLSISTLTLTLSILVLTGHTAYSFYFSIGIILLFFYYFYLSKNKLRHLIIFFTSGLLTILISLVKIYPFFKEVIDGSRVTSHFIPPMLFRPLSILQQFLPDTFSSSIYKSFNLGDYDIGQGTIHQRLAMDHAHATFLYIGIIPMIFAIIHSLFKDLKFFSIISMFFILETFFPIFGIISNAFFFPFQHGSHIYLACFFWSISSAYIFNKIIEKKEIEKIKKYSKIVILVVLLIFITTCLSFYLYFFDVSFLFKKIVSIFSIIVLFFLIKFLFNRELKENSIAKISILSCILFLYFYFFISPIARLSFVGYLITQVLIYNIFKLQIFSNNLKFSTFFTNLIFIVLSFVIYYYLISPYIPSLSGSEDFLNKEYFRIRNQYSEVLLWRHEWFVLIFISLSKFLLICFVFLAFLDSIKLKKKLVIINILFVLIFIDLLPTFISKSNWITKSFVSIDYNKLFQNTNNIKLEKNFQYRYSNTHYGIKKSNLFNHFNEGEVLSNIPYAHGYPSYGGVNSQFPARQINFFRSYIKNKNNEKSFPNSKTAFDIGLPTDFTDLRLLGILGVKYIFEKENSMIFFPEPKIIFTKNKYQIIRFKNSFYILKENEENNDSKRLISNLHKNYFVSNSLNVINCVVENKLLKNNMCIEKFSDRINLTKLTKSLPRFKIFKSVINVEDESEAANILSNNNFNFLDNLVIESKYKIRGEDKRSIDINYDSKNNDNIRVHLNSNCNSCVLLFNDTYNNQWNASYKKRNYKIVPANGVSSGIIIDDNPEYIDLKFNPKFKKEFSLLNKSLFSFVFLVSLSFLIISRLKKYKLN